MERLVVTPGQEIQCVGCPSRLEDESKNDGYNCREVKVTKFGVVLSSPKMIEDASGSLICKSRRPNLSTVIKSLVGQIRPLFIAIRPSLPQ